MHRHGINLPEQKITAFCERNRVAELSLFGSVLRDDFHEGSDVDFLVEFEPDSDATYFTLMEMEEELCQVTARKADLRTPQELSKYIRQRVLDESVTIYVHR